MKNTQENLATLTIWSRNVTASTREPPTCAWIRADIWRQDGAICSKNRKIVPYHRCARIPRLTVSVPDYGSWCRLKSKHSSDHYVLFVTIPCHISPSMRHHAWSWCIQGQIFSYTFFLSFSFFFLSCRQFGSLSVQQNVLQHYYLLDTLVFNLTILTVENNEFHFRTSLRQTLQRPMIERC